MSSSPEPRALRLTVADAPTAVRLADGLSVARLLAEAEVRADARLVAERAAARESARREVADEVEAVVRGVRAEVEALRESLLDTAVELAAVLAEAVLHRELRGDHDLSDAVRACLARSGAEPSRCAVRVHPDALAALERAGLAERLELVPDRDLAPGEVRLDTPVGTLVHDPAEALAQVRDALLVELGEVA